MPAEKEEVADDSSVQTTDEYGNEIAPPKMYTQEELNDRINSAVRDRLSRGSVAEQPTPQLESANVESTADNWEAQLESFIEGTLSKREQKLQQEQMRRQEQETNAAFEIRFNQGASKYQDFERVVVGKPLTPQMVTATRGMQDPAAFIYAAAKTQAPELERISRINDPYAQAVELGKLEERMRKSRASVSKSPRPIDAVKGDMGEKPQKTWSVDDKLRMAESDLRKERMRGRNI